MIKPRTNMEKKEKRKNLFARIRSMDLTEGNLFLKLGIFALPMALTTVFQLLYTTIDLLTVHMSGPGGETSAAAISGNTALINLIIVMFNGLSIGANVAIGNAIGAKDYDHAEKVLSTSVFFSLICGFLGGIFGFLMAPVFLNLIKIDPTYFEEATTYMRIYFVGLPFLMLYNYGSQIHRAMGDSSTPFVVLFISGLINVGFDCLFVFVFGLGVAGVAWATVISEFVSCTMVLLSLILRKEALIHFNIKKAAFDAKCLGEIIRLGLPAGLQGFFFALPNTFIQSALYDIGAGNIPLQNGAIAANNINSYNYAFIEAISSATMAIVAQNYGAKKKDNILKTIKWGLIWITVYSSLYALIIGFFYRPLLSLFVDYDNLDAIKAGQQRLWLIGFTYFLDGYMDVLAGTMKGVRKPLVPAVITAITCTVFRIVFIEFFVRRIPEMRNVLWLYSAYPISWVMANIVSVIAIPIVLKKAFQKMEEKPVVKQL